MTTLSNNLTAVQVDLAVNMAAARGTYTGARLLFELGLPIELARRVLLRPAERRAYRLEVRSHQCCDIIRRA